MAEKTSRPWLSVPSRNQLPEIGLAENGGEVFVHLENDELVFEYEPEPAEAV
jgi:ATP-dependent Clp protease ATP-binding subunit ClpA